jgi:putative heme-binding domain-containing protein
MIRLLLVRFQRICLVIVVLVSAPRAALAQRELTQIPDSDPEIERRSFQVADGFEVNLFAADPLLAKPIQMNFDSRGRLWVASSSVYPQIKPGQTADDKVLVLEDNAGLGKADRITVFADGLLIPTGIEPGDGGVYVANSTDLIHLSNRGGGDRPDTRRTILSGFGTEDTHHLLHTLRWGPDGALYFNQSIYIHSHIETPYGVRHLNGGGIWQFRPSTLELEVLAHGFCNPWGHHFDRWGQSFATDGAYGEGINYVVPGASYVFTPGVSRILAGLNPGSPKHCGLEILSGRHLPESWRGNMLTNDFRGHRVCRFVVSEDGSGYASQEKPELIKTNHAAFRPVDIKMGPDGAIYIADWYNPIIQHGEVDFRDPRRDLTHGRIWRVTAKGRPLVKRPQLVGASTSELLAALKAPEDWTRHHAKRVLKERGIKILPELESWIQHLDAKEPGYEHCLLEALWTYQTLGREETNLLRALLAARDLHARAAAVRVLGDWHESLQNWPDLFAQRVVDEHPQVRLEAVRALAHIGEARFAEMALRALDSPMDKYLDYALWLTARELAPFWLPLAEKGQFNCGGNFDHLLFALEAVGTSRVVRPLLALLQEGKIPQEKQGRALALIASLGEPHELGMIFDRVLQHRTRIEECERLLDALEQASTRRNVKPTGDLVQLGSLIADSDDRIRVRACRLAGLWKMENLRTQLTGLIRNQGSAESLRQAALDGLVALGGPESLRIIGDLATSGQSLGVRTHALIALTALDLERAARLALPILTAADVRDPSVLFSAFLQRKNGAAVLAAVLRDQKLPADVAKLGVRAVQVTGHDEPQLIAALTRSGGLTAGPRVLSAQQMKQLIDDVRQHGDPQRGEMIYRRKDLNCLKCHALAGAGGQVGPDLASIGASAPMDYIIESLLQPNKAIKENYHSLIVATKEGRILTGIKVRETESDLVLRDADDRELVIPLRSIEERAIGGSLMPEGLADPLTHAEFIDLVRFLSELGKVGVYSVDKAQVVRRWQVLEPTPVAHDLLIRTRISSAAEPGRALAWSPAYSKVAGSLPLDDLPCFTFSKPQGERADRFLIVRCHLEVSGSGAIKLLFNQATGLTAWVDGAPIEIAEQKRLKLTPGEHTLILAINLGQIRQSDLRCEIQDVLGSAAHARVVSGK